MEGTQTDDEDKDQEGDAEEQRTRALDSEVRGKGDGVCKECAL